MQKTHKGALKRFKITKKGKIKQRYAAQDHFNAREKGTKTMKKRKDLIVAKPNLKSVKRALRK